MKQRNDETQKAVLEFYDQSDISWTAPGRRDFVLIRTDTGKERLQKTYLMMTVNLDRSMYASMRNLLTMSASVATMKI